MNRRAGLFRAASAALALAALVAASAAAAPAPRPTLKIVKAAPLTLRGSNFKPVEHVKVTRIVAGAKFVRNVTASSAGAFTVQYARSVVFDRCESTLFVSAVGDKGSRAVAKWLPQPVCLADLGRE